MRIGGKIITWPRDMKITVDDHAQHVRELLFVREAWSLVKELGLPDLSPAPFIGESRMPQSEDLESLEQRWNLQWKRAWACHDLAKSQASSAASGLMERYSRPGQEPNPYVPQFWFVEHRSDGIDEEAFQAWNWSITLSIRAMKNKRILSELATAWECGLSNIVTVPYRGNYVHRLNSSHLVVSNDTMQNANLFRAALVDWAENS